MMSQVDLKKIRQAHFIGIGGIGISAIARMMLGEGKAVSGSDQSRSPITEALERSGARIFYRHQAANLPPACDLVVYTLATTEDNPERQAAKARDLPLLSYPETLGLVSRGKYTIAVSGTHGKTTTTAMLARILIAAGLDPTVIVGSLVPEWRSNYRFGKSEYFLVEACEYRRSFLNLSPRILIITNIDNDHLDYYRDLADIQSAFAELASKLSATGALICRASDPLLAPIIKATAARIIDYFSLGSSTPKLELRVPGRHNIENAKAALAAASAVGIDEKLALSAVEGFRGTWRRFESKGKTINGALVYDDYAHHPTEIKAALQAAREVGKKRIIAVFQPHLYSRTKLLFDDFVKSFGLADEVVVAEIYAAREPADQTVSGAALASAVNRQGLPAKYFSTFSEIKKYLLPAAAAGDLILVMGAGNIFELAEDLIV